MEYRVELSSLAEYEFRALYVEKNASESKTAARWFNGLAHALEGLGKLPGCCPMAPEADEVYLDLRHLLNGKRPHVYRILYWVDDARKVVWVLSIRHGARESFLASEE